MGAIFKKDDSTEIDPVLKRTPQLSCNERAAQGESIHPHALTVTKTEPPIILRRAFAIPVPQLNGIEDILRAKYSQSGICGNMEVFVKKQR